jgi:hypothetical protein
MADFNDITIRVGTGAAVSSIDDVKALLAAGYTHVIDCRDDFDDAPLFMGTTIGRRLHYLWNGTPDDGQPKPPRWFDISLEFGLHALSLRKTKVYAHCAAGVNRGPSTAYAIIRAQGYTATEAEQWIRAARPQVGLAYKLDAEKALAGRWLPA